LTWGRQPRGANAARKADIPKLYKLSNTGAPRSFSEQAGA